MFVVKNSNWYTRRAKKRVPAPNYLPPTLGCGNHVPLKLRRCQIQVAEAFFYTLQHDVAGDTTIFGST